MTECRACRRALPASAFYSAPMLADGHGGACRECVKSGAEIECETCSALFRPHRQHAARFCSRACAKGCRRNGRLYPCAVCGTEVYRSPAHVKGAVVCSRECTGELGARRAAERRGGATCRECNTCDKTKPLEAFAPTGYTPLHGQQARKQRCRDCDAEYMRAYREDPANRNRRREYAQRNRARLREQDRNWRRRNPEVVKASRRRDYRKHREAYRRRALERANRARAAEGEFRWTDVVRLWHRQRGECARCEERCGKRPGDRAFHVDHITPLSRGGSNWPRNLQILCPACNLQKSNRTPAEFTLYLRRIRRAV